MAYLIRSFCTLFILNLSIAHCQDEVYMRKLLMGEFEKKVAKKQYYNKKYDVSSALYEFDMNSDNRVEKFSYRYVDGASWLHILDYYNNKIFNYEFDVNGLHARLYKIRAKDLSPRVRIFVMYFYDGFASYLEYKGNARVYFLTMEDNKLKSLSMFKGPMVWEEYKNSRQHYHQRSYKLYFKDYNKDGIKEVIIDFFGTRRIYMYQGSGQWSSPRSRI